MKQRAIIAVSLFSVLFVCLTGCSRDPNVRKQKYLQSGQRFMDQGEYRSAVVQFSNALQVDPRFAQGHYELAHAYLKLQAWNSAYAELARTVDLQPTNYPAVLELGNMEMQAGQTDSALARSQVVLKADPNNSGGHALLANVNAKLGKYDVAIAEMERATKLDPKNAQAYLDLSLFQQAIRQLPQAEASLQKALEIDPKLATAYEALGALYVQQERWADAEQQFVKAVSVQPKEAAPRIALVRFYMLQHRTDKAEQALVETKQALANDPKAYRLLGEFYVSVGQGDKALSEFASLYAQHPKDLTVKKAYIEQLLFANRVDEASKLTDEILKSNAKDADALIYSASIHRMRGQYGEAVSQLETALKMVPDNAFAHYQLGLAANANGDFDRAEREWRDAIRLRPDMLAAQNALLSVAVRKQDWDLLRSIGDQVIKQQPNSAEGYIFRGMSEGAKNDMAASERDFLQGIRLSPNVAVGYLRLGQLRLTQRRFADAEKLAEQALEKDATSAEAIQTLVLAYKGEKAPVSKIINRLNAQLSKAPNSSQMYALLGALEGDNGDASAAEQHLTKAVQLDPNNSAAWTTLARLQVTGGRVDAAMAAYSNWIQKNPSDARPYVYLGTLQLQQNDWQTAQANFKKALELQPNYALAANDLAYVMLQHGGNVDVALGLAQSAGRTLPDSPSVSDTIAMAYIQKGVYPTAIELLEDAVKKNPKEPLLEYHLGLAYQKNKAPAQARVHLQKALQLNPHFSDADEAQKLLAQLGAK